MFICISGADYFSRYILGFAIGPLLLAPLSEYYGRSPIYFGAWFVLVIFQLPLALAPNIGTIIVCRFIAGLGGSAPLTNTGGTISDLFERNLSGNAMRIYGVSSTFGPPFALMISGYIGENLGWRYIFWVFMGITGGTWIVMLATLPETRHSTILEKKAKRARNILIKEGHARAGVLARIGDAHSKGEKRSVHALFATNLTRPVRFLLTEPITLGAAAYNGFIYGIVYLFNESVPLVFGQNHGFSVGEQGLAFTGIAVGVLIAAAFHPLQERYYLEQVAKNGGKGVPEARMYQARFGAFLLPISFFWWVDRLQSQRGKLTINCRFAWCSYSSVHWIVPIIASSLFGAGIYIVVLGILNYVVDSYQSYSASALAGVILIRNTVGAGFVSPIPLMPDKEVSLTAFSKPLFGKQMYTTLGYEWAGSLLGFLSLLFIPIVSK